MVRLIGVPREVGRQVRALLSGSVWATLWRLVVTLVLLAVAAYIALTFSVIGGILAFAVITFIVGDSIAAFVSDTYQRRWTRVSLDPREWRS